MLSSAETGCESFRQGMLRETECESFAQGHPDGGALRYGPVPVPMCSVPSCPSTHTSTEEAPAAANLR